MNWREHVEPGWLPLKYRYLFVVAASYADTAEHTISLDLFMAVH